MADPAPQPYAARRVMSPCKSICIMDSRSNLCLGCKRTIDEIARWSMMNDDERRTIVASLKARKL
ncbi:DUF1289 domain-containing protein [Reyranella sp.]|uniref:DUF1289 domain-containing protein n=1 Tax=Reyranella sp. TaxID=1929291 RepID=UPI003D0EF424